MSVASQPKDGFSFLSTSSEMYIKPAVSLSCEISLSFKTRGFIPARAIISSALNLSSKFRSEKYPLSKPRGDKIKSSASRANRNFAHSGEIIDYKFSAPVRWDAHDRVGSRQVPPETIWLHIAQLAGVARKLELGSLPRWWSTRALRVGLRVLPCIGIMLR